MSFLPDNPHSMDVCANECHGFGATEVCPDRTTCPYNGTRTVIVKSFTASNPDDLPMTLDELQRESYRIAEEHGFWDDKPEKFDIFFVSTHLAMAAGELVGEAQQELRDGHEPLEVYYNADRPDKPEGFPMELADAVIRIAQLAQAYGIDLTRAIRLKQKFNESRPYKHGRAC